MQRPHDRIDEQIRQGFAMLAPRDGEAERCADDVLRRVAERPRARCRILPFPSIRYAYLAAACLALAIGGLVTYYALHSRLAPASTASTAAPAVLQALPPVAPAVEPLPAISTPQAMTQGRILAAGDSRKACKLGLRTRALLMKGTEIRILKEDKEATVVELTEGTIVFDVTPGGSDKVTIWAGSVLYKVVGTFFTVTLDGENSTLDVYHGTVSVEFAGVPTLRVHGGQSWSSVQPTAVARISSPKATEQDLQSALNKLLPSATPPAVARSSAQPATTAPEAAPVSEPARLDAEELAWVEATIDRVRYHVTANNPDSLAGCIRVAEKPEIRQSLYDEIGKMAQQRANQRQFKQAEDLYNTIVAAWPQSSQCEEALLSILALREQRNRPATERYETVQTYLSRFPTGRYAEEMGEREVNLLRQLGKTQACCESALRFVDKYPANPKSEAFLYLAATLLRENLRQPHQAIAEYRNYLSRYPEGTYAEQAMYWSIKLGEIQPTIGQK